MRSSLYKAYRAEARWRRVLEEYLSTDHDMTRPEQLAWDEWAQACEDAGICQQPGCYIYTEGTAYCSLHTPLLSF